MKIADQCVVSIHYRLTDDAGTQIDSSAGSDPLTYLHGTNSLIPGLEKELEGRKPGESFQASIPPEEGYGKPDPALIQEVPLDLLSGVENLSIGMRLQSQAPDGRVRIFTLESIGEETARLNGNHVLAGQVLNFDVSIEEVRAATAEELDQGLV
jgi:FKBP-type peptidyl-prolyl cis-trans isomerase SlyD